MSYLPRSRHSQGPVLPSKHSNQHHCSKTDAHANSLRPGGRRMMLCLEVRMKLTREDTRTTHSGGDLGGRHGMFAHVARRAQTNHRCCCLSKAGNQRHSCMPAAHTQKHPRMVPSPKQWRRAWQGARNFFWGFLFSIQVRKRQLPSQVDAPHLVVQLPSNQTSLSCACATRASMHANNTCCTTPCRLHTVPEDRQPTHRSTSAKASASTTRPAAH